MVYNAADQLMSWPGMHTYTYYPDGSMYQEKDSAGTVVLKTYTYTPDGLLSTAECQKAMPSLKTSAAE